MLLSLIIIILFIGIIISFSYFYQSHDKKETLFIDPGDFDTTDSHMMQNLISRLQFILDRKIDVSTIKKKIKIRMKNDQDGIFLSLNKFEKRTPTNYFSLIPVENYLRIPLIPFVFHLQKKIHNSYGIEVNNKKNLSFLYELIQKNLQSSFTIFCTNLSIKIESYPNVTILYPGNQTNYLDWGQIETYLMLEHKEHYSFFILQETFKFRTILPHTMKPFSILNAQYYHDKNELMTMCFSSPIKKIINLIYHVSNSKAQNFGDDLSRIVAEHLINRDKYSIVYNQKKNFDYTLLCVGSYLHKGLKDSFVFGTGIRTKDPSKHPWLSTFTYYAIRGPLSLEFVQQQIQKTMPIPFGDPALLMPRFFKPKINSLYKDKIGVVPHYSQINSKQYQNLSSPFVLLNPFQSWNQMITQIVSCRAVVSEGLHGLICSDAYQIPNIWLKTNELKEGDFKFHDYFQSQKRPIHFITTIQEYEYSKCYHEGNKIPLDLLQAHFPFL